ncbi:hypothetical protein BXZ70DRAFT_1051184 [Cristinia sonorae]|uniref:Uncharacterized protein n=1 Tax=Cristinia sonorae TaxID=1940300 RepID=A0A8K0XK42_9AGAR|nr:hypothetical protein BXZ70DRAFT_1051184 [Cristinia sonorae]
MALGLAEAAIISTTLEGMLYGVSVLMFFTSFWILTRQEKKRKINYGLVLCAALLLLLSTAEFAVNIVRLIEGMITKGPKTTPDLFYADVTQSTFVVKSILYNLQTLVLDGVVIYRCYIVWHNWLVVSVPILGWLGLAVLSLIIAALTCGTNYALAHAQSTATDVFATATGRWITATYSVTLGVNLLSTGLLAGRIWYIARQSRQYLTVQGSGLNLVVRIVLESGAIYSATVTCALVTFIVRNPAVYILLDLLSPIISIVFNLIIVRVGFLSDSSLNAMSSGSGGRINSNRLSALRFNERSASSRAHALTGQKSMAIELTQYVETDGDVGSLDKASGRFNAVSDDRASSKPFAHNMEP